MEKAATAADIEMKKLESNATKSMGDQVRSLAYQPLAVYFLGSSGLFREPACFSSTLDVSPCTKCNFAIFGWFSLGSWSNITEKGFIHRMGRGYVRSTCFLRHTWGWGCLISTTAWLYSLLCCLFSAMRTAEFMFAVPFSALPPDVIARCLRFGFSEPFLRSTGPDLATRILIIEVLLVELSGISFSSLIFLVYLVEYF